MLSRGNFHDSDVWHNNKMLSQDAQTGRPARPQTSRNRRRTLRGTLRISTSRERCWRTVSASCKRRGTMFRHPHYLEVPWGIQGHPGTTGPHRHLWWLIALLVLLAMFLIGVGVTYGIL